MQLCYDRWRTAASAADNGLIKPPNGEIPACVAHRTHLFCLIAEEQNCRTNLQYQMTKRGIIHKMKNDKCSAVGDVFNASAVMDKGIIIRPNNLICTFRSKYDKTPIKYQHCGLFGDPHLRTFKDEFQTCKVEGAWSLVQNKYIMIMVTNNPVKDHGAATATSKVIINDNINLIIENVICIWTSLLFIHMLRIWLFVHESGTSLIDNPI